ncbi:MAG: hypothetical protein GQ579_03940 [Bacteroidales bacterium]|nr:hypothetical protein [Bacteroidales bacterium]
MEKYLIELLETNNRVIVPDLGAFIIRQQEPQELVFNDLLAFNDGMLTSHIKQQEGISMSKAQVKIEEFVDLVKKVLTKGDIYHLENLGYLKMDDSSKIEFSVTKFPSARAEVVSASTLKQEEDLEASRQPEKDSPEETPVPAEEKTIEEEAPVVEVPEEEDLVLEVPEEEAPEKETLADEGAELKAPEGNIQDEEIQEEAREVGSFTLEDHTAEIEVDASEDTPLIPDAEEPPFLIEEQEQEDENKVSVVGTSQARLEAAAEAAVDDAADDENNTQESEQESESTTETSIPYYVEKEKRIRSIWPWVGGAAALIIILLVAAWFFFPDEVNRIFAGKSAETVTTEEQVSDDSSTPGQETTGSSEEGTASETDAPGSDTEENAAQEAETDQTGVESVEETYTEPEPEPETPPAGQTKKYYIVAGMFSIQTNAEDLVNTLKSKGYDAELFGRHGNLYAVSFSSHVSKTAAVQELNRIREQINPKAWLLYY